MTIYESLNTTMFILEGWGKRMPVETDSKNRGNLHDKILHLHLNLPVLFITSGPFEDLDKDYIWFPPILILCERSDG